MLEGLREFTKVSVLFDIVHKWLALRITDFLHLCGVCVLCSGEFFSKCDSCFYSKNFLLCDWPAKGSGEVRQNFSRLSQLLGKSLFMIIFFKKNKTKQFLLGSSMPLNCKIVVKTLESRYLVLFSVTFMGFPNVEQSSVSSHWILRRWFTLME